MKTQSITSYLISRQWAMDPDHLRTNADLIASAMANIKAETIQAAKAADGESGPGYSVVDGVATIPISGVILKDVPCIFGILGIAATDTGKTMAAIDAALNDPEVSSIMLAVDSPGGSIAGVQELADTVFAVRGLKPINAHISDLAASAALWIASQADAITANEAAMVGSIGVYGVMEDTSGLYAQMGIKVHVLRSHELKGAGVDGDAITPAQLADEQRIIDQAAEMFVGAIARGRGLDRATVKGMATGQVWFAGEAKDRGLIDGVTSAKSAVAAMPKKIAVSEPAVPTKNGAIGAKQEIAAMDQTEVEKQLAEANARNAALAAQISGMTAIRREELITKYRDRIAPAAMDDMRKFGEFCGQDLGKLEAFLKELPVLTRIDRASVAPEETRISADTATGGDLQVAKWLKTNPARLAKFSGVRGFRSDGTFEMDDGTIVTRDELKKLIAA